MSKIIAKTFVDFVINNIYKNYETFKKIAIDRNINLWTSIINITFKLLEIKHRNTISYYSRMNEIVKRFNNIIDQMLIKYCIEQFIKNWNKYLN